MAVAYRTNKPGGPEVAVEGAQGVASPGDGSVDLLGFGHREGLGQDPGGDVGPPEFAHDAVHGCSDDLVVVEGQLGRLVGWEPGGAGLGCRGCRRHQRQVGDGRNPAARISSQPLSIQALLKAPTYACSSIAYFKMVDATRALCFPDDYQLGLEVLVRVAT